MFTKHRIIGLHLELYKEIITNRIYAIYNIQQWNKNLTKKS